MTLLYDNQKQLYTYIALLYLRYVMDEEMEIFHIEKPYSSSSPHINVIASSKTAKNVFKPTPKPLVEKSGDGSMIDDFLLSKTAPDFKI